MLFAEIVKEARLKAGFSQRGLAEKLVTAQKPDGVWSTYIGQIEKGDKVPSDEVCIKLSEVLQLDSDEVLLAAYEAKVGSELGRALFGKMIRSLRDPVVSHLLASKEPLDPMLLEALADPETRSLLEDQPWLEAAARGDENVVPHILEAVRSYATVGEVNHAMKKVFGAYTPSVVI